MTAANPLLDGLSGDGPLQDGLPTARRHRAMLTLGIAISVAVLDSAIANIALPTIARDLAVSPASSIWVVNAYQIAVTVALLPCSSLGDIFGYRRVYTVGLVVFVLASLGCALATSLPMLVAARVLQGFGGAGLMSVNSALIRYIYPHRMLGRGLGFNSLVVATCSALGPSIAALVLSVAHWPWLFAINVPLGLVALALIGALPLTPRAGHRFDLIGVALNAATFGLFIAALEGFGHGQSGLWTLAELAGFVGIGSVYLRQQSGLAAPMLAVDLFRRPIFALSVATSVCCFCAQALAFVSLPFLFQTVGGMTAIGTGLLMTPWPATVAVVAPISGRLSDRMSAGLLGGLGLTAMCLGMVSLLLLPAHPAGWDVAWRMMLAGGGFALFQSPNNRLLLSSVPRERSGAGSGMLSTARLVGQTVGAALVAVCLRLTPDVERGAAAALALGAGLAAIAAVLSSLRMRRQ